MLPEFITEAERFASMEGNVGRKVTRYLEQLFGSGSFACTFECPEAVDIVDKGLFVLRMQNGKESQLYYAGKCLTIDVEANTEGLVTIIVRPVGDFESMRDKQDLLAAFARVMRGFVVLSAFTDRKVLDKMRLEHFERESFNSDDVHYGYLTELVGGNYENVMRTGGSALTLAIALNPGVEAVLRPLAAEDCKAA